MPDKRTKDESQADKFRDAAREHEADGSEAELARYIKQVARKLAPEEEREAREVLDKMDKAAKGKA